MDTENDLELELDWLGEAVVEESWGEALEPAVFAAAAVLPWLLAWADAAGVL